MRFVNIEAELAALTRSLTDRPFGCDAGHALSDRGTTNGMFAIHPC